MMTVDSSALIAIALNETMADRCCEALEQASDMVMSAVTLAEVLIVAQGRGCSDDLKALIESISIDIMPVTETTAEQVAFAYKTWGKGFHPARLNLADCFSYVVAKERNCPLLFVGDDFSQTDIESAL
jgi:ribonuclease VapC